MRKHKKMILWALVLAVLFLGAAIRILYPSWHFYMHSEERWLNERTLIMTGAGNSGIVIGENKVLVIDTKMGSNGEKLAKRALQLAGQRPIVVVNTHFHGDHVNGNKWYPNSPKYIGSYDIVYLKQMIDSINLPGSLIADSLVIDLGGELAILRNMGNGHTLNDLIVYLPVSRIMFTGDLVLNRINPPLFREAHASVDGWMSILSTLMRDYQPDKVVPGHGDEGNAQLLREVFTYFTDMKAAAADPARREAMEEKYQHWYKILWITSPAITIDYILASGSAQT